MDGIEAVDAGLTRFPDPSSLLAGLASVLCGNAAASDHVTLIERRPNGYASTFPSEIVTVRIGKDETRTVFCKYDRPIDHDAHGHRHALSYEAAVYDRVLSQAGTAGPRLYGVHEAPPSGQTWIVLESIDPHMRLDKAPDRDVIGKAARWIGAFHAANEASERAGRLGFLGAYDESYYLGWARRTAEFTLKLHDRYPWLPLLCERFAEVLDLLFQNPPTVIHGEYTPHNILVREGRIYPIDWQTAAIARGEIDLACLIDGWPEQPSRSARSEYIDARWPRSAPREFERTLDAALLYIQLRWLGDRPEWTDKGMHRLDRLHSIGVRLGLVR